MIKKNNYIYRRFIKSTIILLIISANSVFGASYTDPSAWANVYGTKTDVDNIDDIHGAGLVMGVDANFGSDLLMGAAFSIGESKVDNKDSVAGTKTNTETNTYQVIAYAVKDLSNELELRTTGSLGLSDNHSSRSVTGNHVNADFDAWFANLYTQLGRSYALDNDVILTPSIDAIFSYLSTESYTENGSPLVAVHMSERNDDSLGLGARLRVEYKVLTVRLGTTYEVLSNTDSVQSSVISTGNQFTTNGANLNEGFVVNGGIGVNLADGEALSGSLDYDVINGHDADTQILSASVKYKF